MTDLEAGCTVLLSDAPHYKPHLWVVLATRDERVLAVMLRTAKHFTDETLILAPGDHPFIRHPTAVHYSSARWFSVEALRTAIDKGRCHPREPASPDLLKNCRKGLLSSPFTVHAIRDYCRPLWELDP